MSDPATQSAPGAPEGSPNKTSNIRLQQSQAQMTEVVNIMSETVGKVLDRDIKLTEMDGKAEALEASASVFETSAGKLKRKYWWKNCKMMIMLGVICAILMVAIVLYFCT